MSLALVTADRNWVVAGSRTSWRAQVCDQGWGSDEVCSLCLDVCVLAEVCEFGVPTRVCVYMCAFARRLK